MFTLSELESAAAVVYRTMPATPERRWPLLDKRCGARVWVKHENYAPTGAFKVRGGLVYFDALVANGRKPPGTVAATRGNHGQSVGMAAKQHGIPVAVVVPHGNSVAKNDAMRALGVELIEEGHDFQASVNCNKCGKPIVAADMRYMLSYKPEDFGALGPRTVDQ